MSSPTGGSQRQGDTVHQIESAGPSVLFRAELIRSPFSAAACVSGAAAGVLGLTNWAGLLFYLFVGLLVVPSSIALAKGDRGKVSKFTTGRTDVWAGGVVEHAFSYILCRSSPLATPVPNS